MNDEQNEPIACWENHPPPDAIGPVTFSLSCFAGGGYRPATPRLAELAAGYRVGLSDNEEPLIYPDPGGGPHLPGLTLREALDLGIARILP